MHQTKNNTGVQDPVTSFTDAQDITPMLFHTYTQLLLKVMSIPRVHEKNIFLATSKGIHSHIGFLPVKLDK